MPAELNEAKLEEAKNSGDTWVVDFWAEWCGPCQKMAPIYEDVSEKVDDVEFGKVDMQKHQKLATRNNVRALPTLVMFRDGDVVARNEGFMNEEDLTSWINKNK